MKQRNGIEPLGAVLPLGVNYRDVPDSDTARAILQAHFDTPLDNSAEIARLDAGIESMWREARRKSETQTTGRM